MVCFPTRGSAGSTFCMMRSITFCSSSMVCSSFLGSLSGTSFRGFLFSKDSLGLPSAALVFLDRGRLAGRSLRAQTASNKASAGSAMMPSGFSLGISSSAIPGPHVWQIALDRSL